MGLGLHHKSAVTQKLVPPLKWSPRTKYFKKILRKKYGLPPPTKNGFSAKCSEYAVFELGSCGARKVYYYHTTDYTRKKQSTILIHTFQTCIHTTMGGGGGGSHSMITRVYFSCLCCYLSWYRYVFVPAIYSTSKSLILLA